jgi:hypothetical protein
MTEQVAQQPWRRLRITGVEDVGMGLPLVPVPGATAAPSCD